MYCTADHRKPLCVILLLTVVLLWGCAVVKPPSGGPEDKTPPNLLSIVPAPDSTGVGRDVTVSIDFSEDIDAASFKKKINIYPQVEIKKMKAKGGRLLIEFGEELPETTFCIVINSGYRDYHGVESKKRHVFYFSTSDSLYNGSISGRVLFKRSPDSTAVVKLYEIKADTTIDFSREKESRMVFTGFDGSYIFKALPADSSRFLLFAFTDKNGNGRFDSDKEFSASFKDTVLLTSVSYILHGADIEIIDPNEPCEVRGKVVNRTGIDSPPSVILSPLLPEERLLYTRVADKGEYIFPKVKPGAYILTALIDVKIDSVCGVYRNPSDTTEVLAEPCISLPDTIFLKPGEKREIPPVILEAEEKQGGEG